MNKELDVSQLRAELDAALIATTDVLRQAIRLELSKPISLESDRRLQFEVDPFFYGITLCATEETILPGDWLDGMLPDDWFERAENAEGSWHAIISEKLCPWFAECWQAVGGPMLFSPAYLYFHDYHAQQYDLQFQRWLSAEEAFGE